MAVRIRIKDLNEPEKGEIVLIGKKGQSILDICEEHDYEIEHACGGFCACSTCHVIIDAGEKLLSEMEEDEEDRLDMAEGLTLKSRLGCQAQLLVGDGELAITVPKRPY